MVALTKIGTDAMVERLSSQLPGIQVSSTGLELFQSDLFYKSEFPPVASVSPRSAADVQQIVKAALELGLTLSTRGAGLSYSGGYIPPNGRTLLVDTSRMDRIVELNAEDRYVTVEAGVSWATLHDALKPTGLTSPFWGTFSGRHATVGASLSQGAKFYGSASRGTSAESVIGLKVVTGTIVEPGYAGRMYYFTEESNLTEPNKLIELTVQPAPGKGKLK